MIPLPMPLSKIKAYVANQANKPSADKPYAEIEPSINALIAGSELVFNNFKLNHSTIEAVQDQEVNVNAAIVRLLDKRSYNLAVKLLNSSKKQIARDLVVYWVRDFGFLPIIVSGPVR